METDDGRNAEHYPDPTPFCAARYERAEKQRRYARVVRLFDLMMEMFDGCGYKLKGYVQIQEKDGKVWRMYARLPGERIGVLTTDSEPKEKHSKS